ncbi:MAG: TrkH family potassium uptake protein [Betaproteobacteria bacterium]
MNLKAVTNVVGSLVILSGFLALVPAGISMYYREGDAAAFLVSMVIAVSCGLIVKRLSRGGQGVGNKECFAIVALGWVAAATVGALPFVLYGTLPSFTDAFFEAMSGFTTTGATMIADIEAQPHGILFWRSFLHWLGGMGIIVLFIAVLPSFGLEGARLFRVEVPGPVPERLEPRIRETAKALWRIYAGMSVAEIVLLCLGGMTLFDSVTHTFATVSTGGFSTKTASIGAWQSPFIQSTIILFMLAAGGNFALYFRALHGRHGAVFRDAQLRFYLAIVLIATCVVALSLYFSRSSGLVSAVQDAAFQVSSVITTTGFTTADFDAWPSLAKGVLLALMFIGGCTGSTSGAIKVARVLMVFKHGYREVHRLIHPKAISVAKLNGEAIRPDVLNNVLGFVFLYIFVFVSASLVMTAVGLDMASACSSVAATLGNVGPGLRLVGPMYTYALVPVLGKWVLSLCMLLGRLELYPVLVLLVPSFWRRY